MRNDGILQVQWDFALFNSKSDFVFFWGFSFTLFVHGCSKLKWLLGVVLGLGSGLSRSVNGSPNVGLVLRRLLFVFVFQFFVQIGVAYCIYFIQLAKIVKFQNGKTYQKI